jgi:hypothetical protein
MESVFNLGGGHRPEAAIGTLRKKQSAFHLRVNRPAAFKFRSDGQLPDSASDFGDATFASSRHPPRHGVISAMMPGSNEAGLK